MIINDNLYYNKTKDQKKRYLENCRYADNTKPIIDRWFCASRMIEEKEDADLVTFNRKQIIRLYKSFNSKSKDTLITISGYFNDYYNWCISEGYIDTNNFMNYYSVNRVKDIIDEVIPIELAAETIIIKEDLIYNYLPLVKDPVNKFILYAPFCGVYGKGAIDIINIKMEDINEKTKKVKLYSSKVVTIDGEKVKKRKIIMVDDLFIKLANEANSALKYMPEGESEVNNSFRTKRYDYDESCYIVKTCDTGNINTPMSYKTVISRYIFMQKQIGNRNINGGNLYKSGLISYVKEKFEERGISFEKALFELKDKRVYTYSKELQSYIKKFGSPMNDRTFRMKYGDFVDLYK